MRQEDHELEVGLGYLERSVLKKYPKTNKKESSLPPRVA
jgi:hypothetical protein